MIWRWRWRSRVGRLGCGEVRLKTTGRQFGVGVYGADVYSAIIKAVTSSSLTSRAPKLSRIRIVRSDAVFRRFRPAISSMTAVCQRARR